MRKRQSLAATRVSSLGWSLVHSIGLLGLSLTAILPAAGQSTAPDLPAKSQFHLFLLIGQSNMAGRGAIEAEDKVPGETFTEHGTRRAFGFSSRFGVGELGRFLVELLGQIVVERQIFGEANVGFVGRAKPDDDQERLVMPGGLVDKVDRLVDQDLRKRRPVAAISSSTGVCR